MRRPRVDAGREDADPAEHEAERDDLERGQVDDPEDEDRGAHDEDDGDQAGRTRQARGQSA